MTADRLDRWLDSEVELAREWLPPDQEDEYRARLSKTLIAAQLRVADSAGDLGDAVYAALRSHHERALSTALRRWCA